LGGEIVEYFNIKSDGTQSNQWALETYHKQIHYQPTDEQYGVVAIFSMAHQ
jgi:hypothetical protein